MAPAPRPTRSSRAAATDPRLQALAEESGYTIHGRIGAGGMGIVYRAEDADGNDVAIKLLRHEIADDPMARERLAREVAAQRLVRNASIVRILDAELEDADAFVVTEFIDGPTLEDAVRENGGLHPEAVRELGMVLGETLRDIHAAGVVHRDLKPTNVMLRDAQPEDLAGYDPDGAGLDPVVIDFGIAIAAEESRLTSTGLVMGTAAYLDPEVVRTNRTGPEADWWALAALLAFAATGREPYGSGRADVVFFRAERGEIDLEGVPTELGAWLREALQADPGKRPDPQEWVHRLEELDLSRYDDPGETEAISTAGAAAATGAAGSVMGAEPPTRPLETIPDEDPAQRGAGGDAPTQVLSPVPGAQSATAPAAGAAAASDPAPAPGPGPAPTEALPVAATQNAEPRTEVLPAVREPTARMPVIREEIAPAPSPPYSQHAPYPQAAAPPQQAPYPGQGPYPQQAPRAATQPHPYDPYAQPAALVPQAPYASTVQPYPPAAGQGLQPLVPPAPQRPVLVWLGHLLLVGLGAVAPYMALLLLLLLGGSARAWERTHRRMEAARMQGRSASAAAAGIAAPFRFLLGALETALQALLPLLLGLLVGVAIDAGCTLLVGTPPPDGAAFAVAILITVLITWVGLGSRLTRRGAHRMIDAAAPDRLWTGVVAALLLLLLGVVVMTILARDGMVDYFPFPGGPHLENIAFWRR